MIPHFRINHFSEARLVLVRELARCTQYAEAGMSTGHGFALALQILEFVSLRMAISGALEELPRRRVFPSQ
jgi:hypothetical protein